MTRRTTARQGFTLIEVMISSTLAAALLTAVLSGFIFMGRNLARLASYQSLEAESRKAMAYLCRDFAQAQAVKSGTTPTASAATLVLPAGEVTYTYDSTARTLRRRADFGANRDFVLLRNDACECTGFGFSFFTTTDGAPTDQLAPATNVPYSIKQIQVKFVVESPARWSATTRTRYQAASARYLFRNRRLPDGS